MVDSSPREDLLERIVRPENLAWAWRKARAQFASGDTWCDDWSVALFEANLDAELSSLGHDMADGSYLNEPLRPMGQPKKALPDEPAVRQVFWVPVKSQVAWLAVVNVVGRFFEGQMPAWSYGNRLHRAVWYDESDILRFGGFRATSSSIFRPFRQSWPLYRRHIALTVRAMGRLPDRPEDPAEEHALEIEELRSHVDPERVGYLFREFWGDCPPKVYRAHVDLRKFYPSVNLDHLAQNFKAVLRDSSQNLFRLVGSLLQFRVDFSGVPIEAETFLGLSDCKSNDGTLPGIATGLFVGGFLANVAMLDIDARVDMQVRERHIAHFRYVDDHTILATNADSLLAWVRDYAHLLRESGLGVAYHPGKTEPKIIKDFVVKHVLGSSSRAQPSDLQPLIAECEVQCRVDPGNPRPLMTATLTKMSELARAPFLLLNAEGQHQLLEDCRFLLSARLPDDEVRDDTRMSFAAGRIAELAPQQTNLANRPQPHIPNSRYLRLLLRSIHEYPEKLRLWTRALEYCRLSGHADLSPIVKEFTQHLDRLREASPFLSAFLYRFLARQAIACLRTINNDDELVASRIAASQYLASLLAVDLPSRDGAEWWFWPRVAAERGVMAAAVQAELSGLLTCASGRVPTTVREHCSELISQCADLLRAKRFEAPGTDEDAIWVYLWDRRLTGSLGIGPSQFWHAANGNFDLSRDNHAIIFAAHPRFISERAASAAIRRPDRLSSRLRDLAWQFDVAFSLACTRQRDKAVRGTQWSFLARRAERSLLQYVDWAAKQAEAHPHDPRLAEWTMLEIVRRIAQSGGGWGLSTSDYHPHNFIVPKAWTDGGVPRSWESWRVHLNNRRGGQLIFRRKHRVVDTGNAALFPETVAGSNDAGHVWGLGRILLGLLRRSFQWPSQWSTVGQRAIDLPRVAEVIDSLAISSWSAAILGGCLLPRARETTLFELWDYSVSDTTNDPPTIPDTVKLCRLIKKAQMVLEKFQLTVPEGIPRQLVPRSLQQRLDWGNSESELAGNDERQ